MTAQRGRCTPETAGVQSEASKFLVCGCQTDCATVYTLISEERLPALIFCRN